MNHRKELLWGLRVEIRIKASAGRGIVAEVLQSEGGGRPTCFRIRA